MHAHKMICVLLPNPCCQLSYGPSVGFLRRIIPTQQPNDIRQVVESFPYEMCVSTQSLLAPGLHLFEKAFIASSIAEIGGC